MSKKKESDFLENASSLDGNRDTVDKGKYLFLSKKKKESDFLENTSSRSHRDRRPSEKIVANREFFSIVNSLLNSIIADNF